MRIKFLSDCHSVQAASRLRDTESIAHPQHYYSGAAAGAPCAKPHHTAGLLTCHAMLTRVKHGFRIISPTCSLSGMTISFLLFLGSTATANAEEPHDHGTRTFHKFVLEADSGYGRDEMISSWDFKGWIGKDRDKLALKSEGEKEGSHLRQAEFWAMYSRNISEFWDAQVGLRHDTQKEGTSYLVMGFEGLAPYFLDTEMHVFVSHKGDVGARLRQETDLLITQQLVAQPYLEVNAFAQDVPEQHVGGGFSSLELGLKTRYEVTRKFAPYLDLRYERKLGETSILARHDGERRDDFIAALGVRLMF